MAVLVNMLAATLVTCMNRTIGHIVAPSTQCPSMVLVKLTGIQKNAIARSENAKLIKYLANPDFDLFLLNIYKSRKCFRQMPKQWLMCKW